MGGPEKPLSELGRRAYVQYWAGTICRHILSVPKSRPMSVQSISEATYIVAEDVMATLKEMGILGRRDGMASKKKGSGLCVDRNAVREYMARHRINVKEPVVEEAFDLPDVSDESDMDESD